MTDTQPDVLDPALTDGTPAVIDYDPPPPVGALVPSVMPNSSPLAVEAPGGFPKEAEWAGLCQMAVIMANSGLVPAALRRQPENALLVLLTGRDLGITPTNSLQNIHCIDGKISIAPKLQLALLARSGLGEIKPFDVGPTSVSGRVVNADGEVIDVRSYTMAEAPAELKSKSNWKNYPARMLWWRLVGFLMDDHFPEVTLGLYQPDELGAVTDADGIPINPASVDLPDGYQTSRSRNQPAPPKVDPELQRVWDRIAIILDLDNGRELLRDGWVEAGLPKSDELSTPDEYAAAHAALDVIEEAIAAYIDHDLDVAAETAAIADDEQPDGSCIHCGRPPEEEHADGCDLAVDVDAVDRGFPETDY